VPSESKPTHIETRKNTDSAKRMVPKTLPKQSMPFTQIQSLLKSTTITPKAPQTQRISLVTDQKKQETTITKVSPSSSSNKPVGKQSASHSIIMPGQVTKRDLKPKQSPSPRKVEKPKEPTFPMTAAQTLKLFGSQLTDYEKGEILDYEEIYFIGKSILKKDSRLFKEEEKNHGYDDDKGDYNAFVGEHINYRYEIIDMLGKGSFGQAIKCYDHKNKEHVALKIIRSKKRFYHQATVEVKILKYIRDNDPKGRSNVVKTLDYFTFRKHIVIYYF
jgi:dual specificity tyrosine-phosphorylation-regulated kinase 2/3/4